MEMPISPTDCFETMFQGLRDASSTNAACDAMYFDDGLTRACQMVMECHAIHDLSMLSQGKLDKGDFMS